MSTMPTSNHFIDIRDLPADVLRHILDTAKEWKEARRGMPKGAIDVGRPLEDYTLAMIFEKSSTRTRISFEMAMHQLGGKTIVMQGGNMQLGRGETVADTAKVMSRYVDGIMIRAKSHSAVMELAHEGSVPIINALTNRSHPCQIMADLLTLEERFGSLEGKKFAWVGDGNNVAVSLMEAAVKFNFSLSLACPEGYMPAEDALAWATENGGDIAVTVSPKEAVSGAHAVFTDTWVSMGDKDVDVRMKAFAPYQVTSELMAEAADEAVFMHCLPAHRGEEVSADVIDGPQSAIWDEAENRLHAQKAIIAWCLGRI